MARRKLLNRNIFPKNKVSTSILPDYLQFIAHKRGDLRGNRFTPHSLRIGGHTFYSIKNMDADFVHFLGRRAISRVCQLYYRASAFDNVLRLNMFFRSIRHQHFILTKSIGLWVKVPSQRSFLRYRIKQVKFCKFQEFYKLKASEG